MRSDDGGRVGGQRDANMHMGLDSGLHRVHRIRTQSPSWRFIRVFQVDDRVCDRDCPEYTGTVVELEGDTGWVAVRWDHDGELCDSPTDTLRKIQPDTGAR